MAGTAAPQMQGLRDYQAYTNEREYREQENQRASERRMMEDVFTSIYLGGEAQKRKLQIEKDFRVENQPYLDKQKRDAFKDELLKEKISDRQKDIRERRSSRKEEKHKRTTPEYKMGVDKAQADLDKKLADLEKVREETVQLKDFTKRQKAELAADEKRKSKTDKLPWHVQQEIKGFYDERKNAKYTVGHRIKPNTPEYTKAIEELDKYYGGKIDSVINKWESGNLAKTLTGSKGADALKDAFSKGVLNKDVVKMAEDTYERLSPEEQDQLSMELKKMNPDLFEKLLQYKP